MMSDKELIEAQDKDIQNLLQQVREQQVLIEAYKNMKPVKFDYKFGYIYFRMDSYSLTAYRLVNIDQHNWNKQSPVDVTYRFTELWSILMPEKVNSTTPSVNHGCGGSRSLSTCFSYSKLLEKIERKTKKYKAKLNKPQYAQYMDNMKNEVDVLIMNEHLGINKD